MEDPRTRLVSSVKAGDEMRGSTVKRVGEQRRGGRRGLRVLLADGRSAWARPDEKAIEMQFERRA